MSAQTAKVLLTLFGLTFELGGLALVVFDARQARKHAAAVVKRTRTVYPSGISTAASAASVGALSGGREPTLEERIAALESSTATRLDDLQRRIVDARTEARRESGRVMTEALTHADTLDRELRDFMASALGGGRAQLGVVMFVTGAVMAAAANLVSS